MQENYSDLLDMNEWISDILLSKDCFFKSHVAVDVWTFTSIQHNRFRVTVTSWSFDSAEHKSSGIFIVQFQEEICFIYANHTIN